MNGREAINLLFAIIDYLAALPVTAWAIVCLVDSPELIVNRARRAAQFAVALAAITVSGVIAGGEAAVLPAERSMVLPLLAAAAWALCLLAAGVRAAWREPALPRRGRWLPPLRMSMFEALVIAAGTTWLGTLAASAGLDLDPPAAALAGSLAGAMMALYARSACVRAWVTVGGVGSVFLLVFLALEGTAYAAAPAALAPLLALASTAVAGAPIRTIRRRRNRAVA